MTPDADVHPIRTEPATTYPADTWLRSIEFYDLAPDSCDEVPVHVVAGCTVNGGHPAPFTLLADDVVVSATPRTDGTMVSFVVPADDVAWDHPGQDGAFPTMIGGLRVIGPPTPVWEMSHDTYFEHLLVNGKDKPGPTIINGEIVTCRVVIYVRTIAFNCQPK